MIDDIFAESELRMDETIEHYKRQFSTVRTGRASTGLVENIKASYYGNPTPLKQMAKISVPEPALIVIQPWDGTALNEIERAIQKSDTGLVPNSDGKIIRINVPPLTEERRKKMVKIVKKMAEEARVAIRNIRRDANESIKSLLKDKEISEDDAHKNLDKIQDLTNQKIENMDKISQAKEIEILDD